MKKKTGRDILCGAREYMYTNLLNFAFGRSRKRGRGTVSSQRGSASLNVSRCDPHLVCMHETEEPREAEPSRQGAARACVRKKPAGGESEEAACLVRKPGSGRVRGEEIVFRGHTS